MDFLLDIVMEFIFELFLEGAVEGAMSRKVHPLLRFVLLSAIIMIYAALLYVAISVAIEFRSILAWICVVLIVLITVLAVRKKYREYRKRIEQ